MLFKKQWLAISALTRGILQTCPISALLSVLAAEIMSIAIRNDKSIKGFNFGKVIHKSKQHGGDRNLTLSDIHSISNSMKCINNFCCFFSVMGLNIEKTEGIWAI